MVVNLAVYSRVVHAVGLDSRVAARQLLGQQALELRALTGVTTRSPVRRARAEMAGVSLRLAVICLVWVARCASRRSTFRALTTMSR
jgi:hypothetical protein